MPRTFQEGFAAGEFGNKPGFAPIPGNTTTDFGDKPPLAFPGLNVSPAQSVIKQHIESNTKAPEQKKTEYTIVDVTNSYKKALESGKFTGMPEQEVFNNILRSYKSKGYTIAGVDIDEELGLKEPEVIEEVKEEGGIGEAISDFGQAIKPFKGPADVGGIGDTAGQLQMAGKMLTNLPGDTVQLGGEIVSLITNPVDTAKGVFSIGKGLLDKAFRTGAQITSGEQLEVGEEEEVVNAIGTALGKVATDPNELSRLIQENPADIMFSLQGAGSVLKNSKNAKIANIGKSLEERMNPITTQIKAGVLVGKGAKAVGKLPVDIGKTITAKTSGLDPNTLTQLFKNPDLVKSGLTREGTANKVVTAIDTRIDEVGELGKAYEGVKKGEVVTNSDELFTPFQKTFSSVDNKELTKSDLRTIKDAEFYIDKYKGDITDSNLIALRQQLDSIKYDDNGNLRKLSKNGSKVVTALRKTVDDFAKDRIDGLRELDNKFSTEIGELGQLKKMIMDRNGNIKDNYIQTIANLTGKGKEVKLERIRKIVPEIEDEINMLKALEDVEFAKGNKVGTYFQTATLGGGIGASAFTANPLLGLATIMITSPTVISNMVRAAGYSARTVGSITQKIKDGIKLTAQEAKIVSKAVQSQINEQALNAKDSIGGALDDVADKVGARAKFMDDKRGTGISGKIEYGNGTPKILSNIDDIDEFYESMPKGIPEIAYELRQLDFPSLRDIRNIFSNSNYNVKRDYGSEYLSLKNKLTDFENEFIDFANKDGFEGFYNKLQELEK